MKPIIFSTPMVQAILEGRKTMTRRVITPQPCKEVKRFERFIETVDCGFEARFGNDTSVAVCDRKPKYKPGDILWVRETWAQTWTPDSDDLGFVYKADGKPEWFPYWGNANQCKDEVWIPSIFMPRKAARIFLRVTNIRVERLQDITAHDAIREGMESEIPFYTVDEFKELWNNLNAKRGYSWESNPWVWVIEFERINKE
jgi:hypothetical protein